MNLKAELGKLRARLTTLKARSRSFLRVYSWIARDFVSFAGLRMLVLLAMSGISVGIRVGVVAGVLAAIKNFAGSSEGAAGEGRVNLPYLSEIDYTLFGALIFVVLVVNALVSFLYERFVFGTANKYQPVIIGRSFETYARCPNIYHKLDLAPADQRSFVSAVLRHGRLTVVFLRIMLFATFGFITSIFCYLMLIIIKPFVTIVFTIIIGSFLPLFYYLSLNGIRMRELTPIAFGNLGQRARALDEDLQSRTPPPEKDQQAWISALVSSAEAKEAFEAFMQQRFVVFKAQFVSGLLMATILAISVTIFLSSLGQDGGFGNDFVLFFALLFVMGTSLSSSLRAVVAGNRFFRSLKFFHAVLGPGGRKPIYEGGQSDARLGYERVSGDVMPLTEGHVVYLYVPGAGRRFHFQPFVDRLLPVHEPLAASDGTMVLSKLEHGSGAVEGNGAYELTFSGSANGEVANDAGSAASTSTARTAPSFVVLKEPLGRKPDTKGRWVYIWGTRERVVGDLTGGDKAQLPSGRSLSKRLSRSGRAASNAGAIDLDDLDT